MAVSDLAERTNADRPLDAPPEGRAVSDLAERTNAADRSDLPRRVER
jgi:hypothetical protein